MIEGDDPLSRRYRALPHEEPPASLDAAILAAARRAAAPRRSPARWAVPVSVAAVLALAVGITQHALREQPGIEVSPAGGEYSAPAYESAPPAAPPASAPEKRDTPAPASALEKSATPAPTSAPKKSATPSAASAPQPAASLDKVVPTEEQAAPATMQRAQPKPLGDSSQPVPAPQLEARQSARRADAASSPPVAPAAPASPHSERSTERLSQQAAPSAPAAASAPMPPRTKREATGMMANTAKEPIADPRVRELERIAQLRREGRHTEADEALAKFRRENPDYRIPEPLWDRVKPRS